MSLRKIAALLAVFGVTIGLVGSGLGAQFVDQVTATQTISVGTFACTITSAQGSVSADHKSVTYAAPPITSSAAGTSPFAFTVHNGGSINQTLNVTTSGVPAPFSIIGAPFAAAPLAAGGDHTYSTGLSWTELTNANLGQTVTATWTVNCDEAGAANSVIFNNTANPVVATNYPSFGPEAYSFNEWGGGVTFAGTARKLQTATVTLSSWACQTGGGATCVSAPGSTYDVPITFKVYNVGAGNAVGSVVASVTQTFAIPYRPTSNCPTDPTAWTTDGGVTCFHGKAVNIVFSFSGQTLQSTGIFGIAFNTDHHGYAPIGGSTSPTDSLNIATYPGTGTATEASVGTWLPNDVSGYLSSGGSFSGPATQFTTGDTFAGYQPAVLIAATT